MEFISLFCTFAHADPAVWNVLLSFHSISFNIHLKLSPFPRACLDLPSESVLLPLCPRSALYVLVKYQSYSACTYLFTCLSSQSACEFLDNQDYTFLWLYPWPLAECLANCGLLSKVCLVNEFCDSWEQKITNQPKLEYH